MRAPTMVRLNSDDPALLGIRQFYHTVPHHNIPHIVFQRKLKVLLQILVDVPYTQCLVSEIVPMDSEGIPRTGIRYRNRLPVEKAFE